MVCIVLCMETTENTQSYDVQPVHVGSAGHLVRYKVVDANGKYVPGALFKTLVEAITFIDSQVSEVRVG